MIIASERVPWPWRRLHGSPQAVGVHLGVIHPSGRAGREAGLPDGVFNVITGMGDPVGQALAEHPATDFLSFTGSRRVGGLVGGLAASRIKKVGLELGGKGPVVVFADSDLDAAADSIACSVFHNSGQTCVAGQPPRSSRKASPSRCSTGSFRWRSACPSATRWTRG